MKIGVVGKKGSGKDSITAVLVEHFGFERVAFADPIKEMLHVGLRIPSEVLWGNDEVKNLPTRWGPSTRKLAQTLGTEWGRMQVVDDIWIRLALECHIPEREAAGQEHFVVADVRFLNEAEKLRAAGFTILKVVRPGYDDGGDTHLSETELELIEPDETIWNEGTLDDLAGEVTRFAAHLSVRGTP